MLVIACPDCGIGKSCPNRPSNLLAEIHLLFKRGKTLVRSEQNCSPSHRDTSHPVTRMPTEPS